MRANRSMPWSKLLRETRALCSCAAWWCRATTGGRGVFRHDPQAIEVSMTGPGPLPKNWLQQANCAPTPNSSAPLPRLDQLQERT
jgi:hypothetical protein